MIKIKKAAAFTLALLLIFSITAAPTGQMTSYAGYNDSGSIAYTEAVEALSELGVLAGYEDNTFRPERNVTRAEASKIICYILIGTEEADALKKAPTSFDDVAQTHWANPFIEYCASKGIITGYGDGRFGPGDNVTAAQMAKMLLTAIGYGAQGEFEGVSWMRNTVDKAQAKGIEILTKTGAGDFSAPATREQIAQYTYNTLTIPNMVMWDPASGEYKDMGMNLMFKSFGEDSGEKLAGYVDPEQYVSEGWSKVYRSELVDGLYYNSCGYAIKESDYRDMLSKRSKIYSQVITSGMDTYDKVQAIHDWVCDNITYNHAYFDHQSTWKPTKSSYQYEHQLGWAGLMLGTAVCAGYSDAYKFLLDGLGIDCVFIYGPIPNQGGQHAWNLVKIEGAYYHVDTTWDDQETFISYFYFLDSDSTISSKKGSRDYREWERGKFPSCPKDYSFPTISASVNNPAYGGVEGSFIGWGKGQTAAVKGTTIYISAKARAGYEFDFWEVVSGGVSLGNVNSPDTSFIMPNSNVQVKANFKQSGQDAVFKITVSVNDSAFGTASADQKTAERDTKVLLCADAADGYVLEYWEVNSSEVKINVINPQEAWFTMPGRDVSIRASFKPVAPIVPVAYKITMSVNDFEMGSASASAKAAAQGETVLISAITNEGYEFESWEVVSGGVTISEGNSPDAEFTMPNSDVTIIAHFGESL